MPVVDNHYDLIVIGGGASGLFLANQISNNINCLVIEHTNEVGKKLLMSGKGQCNLTHDSNIKDFIEHYGENGKRIRSILYKYNNIHLKQFFKQRKLPLITRSDNKVFPETLKSQDVKDLLVKGCQDLGVEIKKNCQPFSIEYLDNQYLIETNNGLFRSNYLVIATGGSSYPRSGSDGSFLSILKAMNIPIVNPVPALVTISLDNYLLSSLSGISIKQVELTIEKKNGQVIKKTGDLLFTHKGLSGPLILNASRYIEREDQLYLNYLGNKNKDEIIKFLKMKIQGNTRQVSYFLSEYFEELAKRIVEVFLEQIKIEKGLKASALSGKQIELIVDKFTRDQYQVNSLGDFNTAMVTKGGVSLESINLKTLESKKYPNLYFIGEVLDIDGDTGGYNLQFAFSSAHLVSEEIKSKISKNRSDNNSS
jgi:flavoprotein, HI0933 family